MACYYLDLGNGVKARVHGDRRATSPETLAALRRVLTAAADELAADRPLGVGDEPSSSLEEDDA